MEDRMKVDFVLIGVDERNGFVVCYLVWKGIKLGDQEFELFFICVYLQ